MPPFDRTRRMLDRRLRSFQQDLQQGNFLGAAGTAFGVPRDLPPTILRDVGDRVMPPATPRVARAAVAPATVAPVVAAPGEVAPPATPASAPTSFPRTRGMLAELPGQVERGMSEQGFAGGLGQAVRGALGTGLVAVPLDVGEALLESPVGRQLQRGSELASNVVEGAGDFASALFLGGEQPQRPTESTVAPPRPLPRPVREAEAGARAPTREELIAGLLESRTEPRRDGGGPGVTGGLQLPAIEVPDVNIEARLPLEGEVLGPRRLSAIERSGVQLPELPDDPTAGDLMRYRLENLNARARILPFAAQDRAEAAQRGEERLALRDLSELALGQQDVALRGQELALRGANLERQRQADIARFVTDAADAEREQANRDRTADIAERGLQLQVLEALKPDTPPTFEEQLDELNARQRYVQEWPNDELGWAALDIQEETGVPAENLRQVLEEELRMAEEAGGEIRLDSPDNVQRLIARLRERANAASR